MAPAILTGAMTWHVIGRTSARERCMTTKLPCSPWHACCRESAHLIVPKRSVLHERSKQVLAKTSRGCSDPAIREGAHFPGRESMTWTPSRLMQRPLNWQPANWPTNWKSNQAPKTSGPARPCCQAGSVQRAGAQVVPIAVGETRAEPLQRVCSTLTPECWAPVTAVTEISVHLGDSTNRSQNTAPPTRRGFNDRCRMTSGMHVHALTMLNTKRLGIPYTRTP